MSFLFDTGMFVFFFLYNLYLLDCGFNEKFLGLVTSAMAVGGIVGTIPAGIMGPGLGLRRRILLCLTLVTIIGSRRLCNQAFQSERAAGSRASRDPVH